MMEQTRVFHPLRSFQNPSMNLPVARKGEYSALNIQTLKTLSSRCLGLQRSLRGGEAWGRKEQRTVGQTLQRLQEESLQPRKVQSNETKEIVRSRGNLAVCLGAKPSLSLTLRMHFGMLSASSDCRSSLCS